MKTCTVCLMTVKRNKPYYEYQISSTFFATEMTPTIFYKTIDVALTISLAALIFQRPQKQSLAIACYL